MKNIKKGICALLLSATNFAYAAEEQSLTDIIADVKNSSQISQKITPAEILKRDELIKLNNIDNNLLKGNKLIQEDKLALKGEELIERFKLLESDHARQKNAFSELKKKADYFKENVNKDNVTYSKKALEKRAENAAKSGERLHDANKMAEKIDLEKDIKKYQEFMKKNLDKKKALIKELEIEMKNAKKEALNNLKIQKENVKAQIKNASKSTTDDAMKNLLKARKKEINQSIQEIDPNVLKKFASKLF